MERSCAWRAVGLLGFFFGPTKLSPCANVFVGALIGRWIIWTGWMVSLSNGTCCRKNESLLPLLKIAVFSDVDPVVCNVRTGVLHHSLSGNLSIVWYLYEYPNGPYTSVQSGRSFLRYCVFARIGVGVRAALFPRCRQRPNIFLPCVLRLIALEVAFIRRVA